MRGTPLAQGNPLADTAVEAFLAGVAAADPTKLVKAQVRRGALDGFLEDRRRPRPVRVLALGKAAPRMVWGLVEAGVPFSGVGATVPGQRLPELDGFQWSVGEHPVPGEGSLRAGRAVLDWVQEIPEGEPVLVLLSGGASSCVEQPAPGLTPLEVQARHAQWLREGIPVTDLNHRRARDSALKGGSLARIALERTGRIQAWLLADTPVEAAPEAVGSGPFFLPETPDRVPHTVLGDAGILVQAAGLHLASSGWSVHRHGARIEGALEDQVEGFLDALASIDGKGPTALVGAGEATVALPEGAPPGGRCRHAALVAARRLHRDASPALFLAGASDGRDGTAPGSGAWADAATWDGAAAEALAAHGAAGFLDARGRTFDLGATGTNVNDLFVALRP